MRRDRSMSLAGAVFVFVATTCARNETLPPEAFVVAPSDCAPRRIAGDVTLDVDIRAVRLEGTFAIDGQRIPGGSTGGLSLLERRTHAPGFFLLDDSAGEFTLLLPPGTYDVMYQPPGAACGLGANVPIPCSPAIIERGLELTSGVVRRDLRLTTARIRGGVRVDAGEAPIEGGALVFTPRDLPRGAAMQAPIASDHTYDVRLAPATYDIAWLPPESCTTAFDLRVPCALGPIGRSIVVTGDDTFDLVLPTAMLDARMTLDGAAAPVATSSMALLFRSVSDQIFVHDLMAGTHVQRRVIRGDYAVSLRHFAPCPATGDNPWPCGDRVVNGSLHVEHDLITTVDIATARVRGEITLRGAMFPQLADSRGTVLWRDISLRSGAIVNNGLAELGYASAPLTGTGGPARFDLRISPGHYDVVYERSAQCGEQSVLPCGTSILAQDVVVDGDATRDYDIRTASLRVDLLRDGRPLAERGMRGALQLMPIDAREPTDFLVPPTGPSRVETPIAPGRYRVSFVGPTPPCDDIACGVTVLRDDVQIDSDTTWSFEVPHAVVHGQILLNGLPFVPPTRTSVALSAFGIDNETQVTTFFDSSSYRFDNFGAGRYYFIAGPVGGCSRFTTGMLCAREIIGCE